MLRWALFTRREAVIVAHTIATLAGLAVLGAFLPLTQSGGAPRYAAVFRPGSEVREAVASLAQAGPGWRVLRVLAAHPVPVLMLAHEGGAGPWPGALLLPVPLGPGCLFSAPRR